MGQEAENTNNETDAFEVHLTEAAGSETPSQENKGDDSATTQENGKGQDDQGKKKEEGQDDAEKKASADDTGEESQPKNRGRSRLQKRIDRLTRRNKEMEAQLAAAKAEKPAEKPSKNTETEPDPTDFDSYDDYLAKLAEFKANKKPKQEKPADKPDESDEDKGNGEQPEVDQEFIDALEDVQEAFADSRKQYEDFDKLISAEDLMITSDMVKALAETENPGDIAYHLAKNKDEASRIAGLSPLAQAREIGKLEVSVATKKPLGKKTTEAPDPIEPVRGADSTVKTVDQMDFSEYERTMNEQDRSKGSFW